MNDFDKRYKVLDTVNQWIFNCDTKASILLATIGVFFTVLLSSDIFRAIVYIIRLNVDAKNVCSVTYLCVGIGGMSVLTVGIYKLIRVLIPSVNVDYESVMFFGNVSKYQNISDYNNAVLSSNDDSIKQDLLQQIYVASKICNKKFENQKSGIKLSMIGGGIVLLWLMLGFIVYYI